MFCKIDILRNFAKFPGKHLCQSLFFNKVEGLRPEACNLIKKETLAHVFSSELCEISNNIFFYRTPLVAASDVLVISIFSLEKILLTNIYSVVLSLKFIALDDPTINENSKVINYQN